MTTTYDKQIARARVTAFVRDKFDDEDIAKIDRIIGTRATSVVTDRARSSAPFKSFEERFPDSTRIKTGLNGFSFR